MIIIGLSAKIIDVKIAFLYSDLDKEISMDCQPGTNDTGPEDALLLNKYIYKLAGSPTVS